MLVKFQADDALAESLMQHTGQRVASKAFQIAALSAPGLAVDLHDARQEIARLRRIIDRQQQVLENARQSAALLLEAADQGDLFMEKVPAVLPSSSRPTAAELGNGTETGSSPRVGESMDHFLARLNRQPRPRP